MENRVWNAFRMLAILGGTLTLLVVAWARPPADGALRAEIAALDARVSALRDQVARSLAPTLAVDPLAVDPLEVAAWADELADLRSEVEQLRRELSDRRVREAGVASADLPQGDTATSAALARQLDDRIQIEAGGADAREWEDDLRARIDTLLPPGAGLRQLTCRISLCRAELSYPDLASYVSFVDEHLDGGAESLWPGVTFLHVDSEDADPVIVTAYLALALDRP